MIPVEVDNQPVRYYVVINPPRFPRGYPGDGDLEKTVAFLISVSHEGDPEHERFWVSCLGEYGKLMAGEMCYTLEAAKAFPSSEFDIEDLAWTETTAAT